MYPFEFLWKFVDAFFLCTAWKSTSFSIMNCNTWGNWERLPKITNGVSLRTPEGYQQITTISGAIMVTLKKAPFYEYSTCLYSFQTLLKQGIVMPSWIVALDTFSLNVDLFHITWRTWWVLEASLKRKSLDLNNTDLSWTGGNQFAKSVSSTRIPGRFQHTRNLNLVQTDGLLGQCVWCILPLSNLSLNGR